MAKVSKSQALQRVREIEKCLLRGHTRSYVIQYASENHWGISDRQVDTYIARANERIQETVADKSDQLVAKITNNRWDIYRRAIDIGDLNQARQVLSDIAKTLGLDSLNVNLKIDRPLKDLSDSDLEAALAHGDSDE